MPPVTHMITARFGNKLILLALLALGCSGLNADAASPPRPDVLLIMPDQMRGDCLSVLGHPAVRTPTLDNLAREGALFRRAYSTCPSCIPARHSLLTGLFPSSSGVVGFAARPITSPAFPALLAKSGYATVLTGRYMHQLPKPEHYGFDLEIRGSTHVDDDEYDAFLQKSLPDSGGIRSVVKKMGLSYNGWEAKPWELAADLHPTVWIVKQARAVLKESKSETPIFLTASFYAPHPPLFPPKQLYDRYYAQPRPEPAHGDWVDWKSLSPQGDKQGHRVLLQGETLRATQAGYFGLIEQLDSEVAPLIADFKARSQEAHRPWLILVTSDHGEMLGDHGYFRKCEPYEGSANVPFLIAGSPELGFKRGLRLNTPVCLEDIMPTLLEVAGAKTSERIDGISLLPVLRADTQIVRQWLHSEHAACYGQPQAFQALTDGTLKYIWRPASGAEQLFNLEKDPREEHDLARDPNQRAALAKCRSRLLTQLAGRPEGFVNGTNLLSGRPYPPLQARLRP